MVAPPVWDRLVPGPYGASLKTLFRYDSSRTWKVIRAYYGKFSPEQLPSK